MQAGNIQQARAEVKEATSKKLRIPDIFFLSHSSGGRAQPGKGLLAE
jgi:hypothetical protein